MNVHRLSIRATAAITAAVVLCLLVAPRLLGAEKRVASAKKKPGEQVSVVQTDGKTVRGELVSSDIDGGVVVQPAPAKGAASADPVTIAWPKVKSVSNGLTRAKLLIDWKGQHYDELCATCGGDREIFCSTCKGTGHDPAAVTECKTCGGDHQVECKTPRCKDGKMPCPETCIKRYEGRWVEQDGKMYRFWGSRGYGEAHVGERLELKGNNIVANHGKCWTCAGTTYVDDPECVNGLVPCPKEKSDKTAPACPNSCTAGRVRCESCNGTGLAQADANHRYRQPLQQSK